jgi:phage baseplate assembly protein W
MNLNTKEEIKTLKNPYESRDFLFIQKLLILYLFNMAQQVSTYGIQFPFIESVTGTYFGLSYQTKDEIRGNLLHLLLTQKGTRYYDPDFGTDIYKFIFDPLDGETFERIKEEVQVQVEKYIPNLRITDIKVEPYTEEETDNQDITREFFNPSELVDKNIIRKQIATDFTPTTENIVLPFSGEVVYDYVIDEFDNTENETDGAVNDVFRIPGPNTIDYTAKLTIIYVDDSSPFGSKEFVIINI